MTRHPFMSSTHAFTCRDFSLDPKNIGRDNQEWRGYLAGAFGSDDGSETPPVIVTDLFVISLSSSTLISACNSMPVPFPYCSFEHNAIVVQSRLS